MLITSHWCMQSRGLFIMHNSTFTFQGLSLTRCKICGICPKSSSCYSSPEMMAFDRSPTFSPRLFGLDAVLDVVFDFAITGASYSCFLAQLCESFWFVSVFLAPWWCQNVIMCLFVDSETHCFIRKGTQTRLFAMLFLAWSGSLWAHKRLSCC